MAGINDLWGVTTRALIALDERRPVSSAFFKPYDSALNFFMRAAAIITVPIICTLQSAYFALDMIFQTFRGIYYFIKSDTEKASDAGTRFINDTISLVTAFVAIFISPAVELIDVVGSAVMPEMNQETESMRPTT